MKDIKNKGIIETPLAAAGRILDLRPEKRVAALIELPNAAEVVRAMPAQEFWLTYKNSSGDDLLTLLELADGEKLEFIQDVDCWIGERMDPQRLEEWFKTLVSAGEQVVSRWLRSVSPENFILSLGQFMIVTKPDEGSNPKEIADTLPPVTLDGVYYLHFFGENAQEAVVPLLRQFAQLRLDLFTRMMEGFVWEQGVETEDLAIRFHNGRLRDHGIPDIVEALTIYHPLDEKNFFALDEKSFPEPRPGGFAAPKFPLIERSAKTLINDAISRLPEGDTLDGVLLELSHLANKVVVADALDTGDPEQLREAVAKVKSVINMGLEILCGKDADNAAGLLKTRWLIHIFQIGYGRVASLFMKARHIRTTGWMKNVPDAGKLLGSPMMEIFAGLNRKRPMKYVGGAEPYRFFRDIGEVNEAVDILNEIEYLGDLFIERLELITSDPKSWRHTGANIDEVTFDTILRTAVANAAAGKGFVFKPLARKDIANLIEKALTEPKSKTVRKLAKNIVNDLKTFLDDKGAVRNDDERRFLDKLVKSSLKFLEDELGRLGGGKIEPKYIQGFVVKK